MSEVVVTTPEALSELLYGILSDVMAKYVEPPQSDWMTTKEAAAYLRCSLSQIHILVSEKTIPVGRVGRKLLFSKRALDEWVASST